MNPKSALGILSGVISIVVATGCAGSPAGATLGGGDRDVPACVSTAKSIFTRYQSGSIAISLNGEDMSLQQLGDATFLAGYEASCPSRWQAEWTDGLSTVTILAGMHQGLGEAWSVAVTIERFEADPPLRASADNCQVSITRASERGLMGEAVCSGLQWTNAYDAALDPDATALPGFAPFDARLTFEAEP